MTGALPAWSFAMARAVINEYNSKLCGEITPEDDRRFKHAWACIDAAGPFQDCPRCNGLGFFQDIILNHATTCANCLGTGMLPTPKGPG